VVVDAEREWLEALGYGNSRDSEQAEGTGRVRGWSLPGGRVMS
jgi:hypothetical protein